MAFDRSAKTKWFDRLEFPGVVSFYERLLDRYDDSLVEWVKLTKLPRTPWSFHCDRPVRTKPRSREYETGYRIRCGVNVKRRYPYEDEIVVGWDPATETEPGSSVTTRVTFATPAEAATFALGCAVFRFLRHSRQIPGLDIRSRARRHGLYCLAVERSGLPFDPFEATDRLVARDALEEAGDEESRAFLEIDPDG